MKLGPGRGSPFSGSSGVLTGTITHDNSTFGPVGRSPRNRMRCETKTLDDLLSKVRGGFRHGWPAPTPSGPPVLSLDELRRAIRA